MINTKTAIPLEQDLSDFAVACKNSLRYQGDGWGMVWRASNSSAWQVYHSPHPIWEDVISFSDWPKSTCFFVHARGSSFAKHKGNVSFNQPFVSNNQVFVFNGFLNGVNLPVEPAGQIGSQKIFNLLQSYQVEPLTALLKARVELENNSKLVEALNVIYTDGEQAAALCCFMENEDYYRLRYLETAEKTVISSVDLPGYDFKKMNNREFKLFKLF